MLRIKYISVIYLLLCTALISQAQTKKQLTQTVRGLVKDSESNQPLVGVLVVLLDNTQLNAVTDDNGYYTINNVPIGRHTIRYTYMGYEEKTAAEVLVTSGKTLELNMTLTESLQQLNEVTVRATNGTGEALNEFATISARSFSVEETKRYAGSLADPARMAMNFMGVSNGGDMDNGIVVRGNSPKGVLWRLEGIEIPSPNHFGSLGTSGGAISMLNPSMLGTSDFYTGAFPAEMGNALSGVFDMNFRNGNKDRREHTFQIGVLGTEIASEGPFKKGGGATYLFNYRYSTLALLNGFFDFGGVLPAYQDGSFKINIPTQKAGNFSIFGLGGYNAANKDAAKDSTKWNDDDPNFSIKDNSRMGVVGVTHSYFLNSNSYVKTVLSTSYNKDFETIDTLNPSSDYRSVHISDEAFTNTAYRASILYNTKLNKRSTVRAGVIVQHLAYSMDGKFFDEDEHKWKSYLEGEGSTQFYQAYTQWKYRATDKLTIISGLHGSYYALNKKYSIEPRVSATYQTGKNTYTLAAGLHSRPEHVSTYLFQNKEQNATSTYPNKDLDLLRAAHFVAGYKTVLPLGIRFNTEVYYQHLYSIPVEQNDSSGFSLLNAFDIYSLGDTDPLVSDGTGQNYGIDISFEKPFRDNYFFSLTGSLYKSTYTTYGGATYNTLFNRGHQFNVLGGKEFKVGKNGKNILGVSGKILYSGGLRETPIDLQESIAQDKTVYVDGKHFAQQTPAYYRVDATVYYKMNRKRSTHSIQLDVQNVTNRQNVYFSYFDSDAGKIKTLYQLGFFPNIAYRIDFQW